jgi:hypothetical protein
MVFPADPTGLVFPSGPGNFKHVGQYWFGVSQENAYACSNQNPNEWPDVGLLLQAYETIHPA